MTDVLGLLARIAAAGTVDDVWALLTRHMAQLGFSRLNYGFTRYRSQTSIGSPEDAIYLSSADPTYTAHYFGTGFYARTPMYRWIMNNVGTSNWRWVEQAWRAGALPPDEAEAVRVNHLMGIIAGVSISFPETSPRSKGALGIIADAGLTHDDVDRIWATEGAAIIALANMAHLRITSLPFKTDRRALTDRQREALEWVADGKTTQDIAILMRLSVAMVEKHLRLARDALDVDTSAQAVAKAAMLNQIFIGAARPAAAGRR